MIILSNNNAWKIGEEMGSENRKKSARITIRLSPEEKDMIAALAGDCDLSPSSYLRQLGLAYQPKSTIDKQAFDRLAKLNADLGRIGGLLKMWLSSHEKNNYGKQLRVPDMVKTLDKLQKEIADAARKL